jgi:hypothetical protein
MLHRTASAAIITALLATAATHPAHATTWNNGDLITYSQDNWGADPAGGGAAKTLDDHYNNVYLSGLVEVGIAGSGGFSMLFTNTGDLFSYLPASGSPGSLTNDLVDPSSTPSGEFGGVVMAFRFNIDFYDAGLVFGTSGLRFGDLILTGFANTTIPALDGLTVRQFMEMDNTALGGGSTIYGIPILDPITINLENAFEGGGVSTFAQDHLSAPVPEPTSGLLAWLSAAVFPIWRRRRLGSRRSAQYRFRPYVSKCLGSQFTKGRR